MGVEFAQRSLVNTAFSDATLLADSAAGSNQEDGPTVSEAWLRQAMVRLRAPEVDLLLRQKIMPYAWLPTCTVHATVHEHAHAEGQRRGLNMLGQIPKARYRKLVREYLGAQLEKRAVNSLRARFPWASAHYRLSSGQQVALLLMVLALVAGVLMADTLTWVLGLQLLSAGFFTMVIALRFLCLLPAPKQATPVAVPLSDSELPVYTILVPLFRETAVLRQLFQALNQLDYPTAKLDIKIILEEDDRFMHVAIQHLALSPHFDVIVVPRGLPQTKPRALNYALHFARGSLLTIYDGEDVPDARQLRLAAAQFAVCPPDVACLQAALEFYNPHENWLTQHFSAEYAGLFRVILPSLGAYGLPLPLGGTSNHFRRSVLEKSGGWDAFNVTEDIDLGIRLARLGYRSDSLASVTGEEATVSLGNWMRQRRRWLKGFLLTWLVHSRNPLALFRQLGGLGFCTVQAMTLGTFMSALLHPFLVAHLIWSLLPGRLGFAVQTPLGLFLAALGFALLLAGYGLAIAVQSKGLKLVGIRQTWLMQASFPLYWLLITCAAWMALWDLIRAPFHWHKTQHGVSRQLRPQIHK